jgi:hypothetical protein
MKRLVIVAAICVMAAPAIASPDLLPYSGIAGTYNYDLATGEQTPVSGERVLGPHIWGPTSPSGWFAGDMGVTHVWLDWGDLGNLGYTVGGFGWGYATNANQGSVDLILCFYGDDNGWNTPGRDLIAAFSFTGLNGTITPADRTLFWGWRYRAELVTSFVMSSNDLDGDGLGDFSYTYWFDHPGLESPEAGPIVGPLIAGDPNVDNAPGMEDAFDIFNEPNYVPMPGYIDPNLTNYQGSYWYGGPPNPYAQFYMELFAAGCPNRGDSGRYCEADIDGSLDCVISLSDLAQLLGNYGCTTGCTKMMGDVDPYDRWFPGDGVIGLGDLAELLGQYGDNCNWPQP